MGRTTKKTNLTREFSAGGAVFKKPQNSLRSRLPTDKQKRQILWLVTKSKTSKIFPKGFWRLPKGWLDDKKNGKLPGALASGIKKANEEELRDAATREVREEGGIEAKIIGKIGTQRYYFKLPDRKILKFVTFYLMEWSADITQGPGWETEKVVWLPFEEARKKLTYSAERKVLDKARAMGDIIY